MFLLIHFSPPEVFIFLFFLFFRWKRWRRKERGRSQRLVEPSAKGWSGLFFLFPPLVQFVSWVKLMFSLKKKKRAFQMIKLNFLL